MVAINLQGHKELQEALRTVRTSVMRRVLRATMKYAVKPMADGLKVAAPSSLGALGRSISVNIKVYKTVGFAAVGPATKYKETFVGTFPFSPPSPNTAKARKNQPSKYVHLVERGASPHFIPAPGYGRKRNAGKIRTAKAKGGVPGWQHPGAKAKPFMEPTAQRYEPLVLGRIGDRLRKVLRAEFEKAKRRGKKFWMTD